MFVTTRKILILFSLAGVSFGLDSLCRRRAKPPSSLTKKGLILERPINNCRKNSFVSWFVVRMVNVHISICAFKVGRLGNMFQRYLGVLAISVALLIGSFSISRLPLLRHWEQFRVPHSVSSPTVICGVTFGPEMLVPRK